MIDLQVILKKIDDMIQQSSANQVYLKGQQDMLVIVKKELTELANGKEPEEKPEESKRAKPKSCKAGQLFIN